MRLNTRSKITSLALKTLSGAIASAVLFSSAAYAAGLGKLTVLSSLGQPLNAEIELTAVSAEEAGALTARLANAEAFRQANIDFNPALLTLRFSIEKKGSRQFIKVTSTQPVNEPFVDMLLELNWNSGRLVREYTFLLDPAEMRATQAPQATPPVDVLSQGKNTKPAPAAKPAPAPAPAQASQSDKPADSAPAPQRSSAASTDASGDYKVKKGDTLGKIAAELKPAEVSLDMMLVALYRANPDAFNGSNMNRLKSGQILSVPDTAAIKATSNSEARGVVVAHAADFSAYRNKLAGQVATAAPDKAPEASQSTGGKITSKVEERRTPVTDAQDKLKLSKATTDAGGKSASAEDRIAKEKALADANARVKELERNVSELEKLMVVKNKAAADAAKAPAVAAPAAKPPVAAAPAPAPAPVVTPPAATPPAAKPPVAAAPATSTPAPVADPAPAPAVEATPPAPVAEVPPQAPKPVPKKKVAPPPPPEPGIVDMIMDNIMLILGALAALAVAAGAMIAMKRRRENNDVSPHEPSILGAPTDQAHSLFAETGGQSVDTNNSVFNSSFAPSASQLDTNEVDPVAEADVYIAYGRDAQAEEILKEALRTHPDRLPVRLKLMEIYAARKDLRAFETQASDLYSMTKGQGDEWAQAAALGMAVDPGNPLYASAAGNGPSTIIPGQEAAQPQAVSLGKPSDQGARTDVPAALHQDTAATAVPAAKPAEDQTLDFDLGGLSFEPVAQTDPIAMPGPAASSNNVPDLDFSMPSAVTPVAAKADDAGMDFNMDFDLPGKADDVPATDLSAEYAASNKDDLTGMGDLAAAFDIPQVPVQQQAPAAAPSLDLADMNFDLPASPAAPASPSFDMSSINLDLPQVDTASTALPEFDNTVVMEAGDQSAMHTEMDTKLDLAIAYQEIGDKEGARELLDEVIKGGSAEQVGKATQMRAKLA